MSTEAEQSNFLFLACAYLEKVNDVGGDLRLKYLLIFFSSSLPWGPTLPPQQLQQSPGPMTTTPQPFSGAMM